MKLRLLVVALIVTGMTVSARAQGGLYLNPIVTRISNSQADTGTFAFLGEGKTSQIFGGVMIGGYYDVFKQPKFDVSIDMRDVIQHGNGASINSFLAGVRVAAKPVSKYKPYVQLSFGDGRTKAPHSPIPANKLEWDAFVGVDRPLNKRIDWRVIELGYGSVTTINSDLYSGPIAIPAASMIHFSTGFVFRLP